MRVIKKIMLILFLGMAVAGAYACPETNKGPAESAGEKIDDAAEDVGDRMEDIGDRAEDAVDDADK